MKKSRIQLAFDPFLHGTARQDPDFEYTFGEAALFVSKAKINVY